MIKNASKYFLWILVLAGASFVNTVMALPPGFEVYFNDAQHSSPNGIDTALVDFINSADVSVEGAFYSITRSIIVDAFIEAANRLGTDHVRIITDASNRNDSGTRRLEAAGVLVIDETCDGWSTSALESHNKFCIVDGQKVWTGSYNITDNGSVYNNNNAVMIDCPELAQAYLTEFNEMWGSTSGASGDCHFSTHKETVIDHTYLCNGVQVDLYFSPTKENPPERALESIMDLFSKAEESLYFCIYTFTSIDIATEVIDASKAGIAVQGVMDDDQAASQYSVYNTLRNQGVDVILDSNVTPHGNYLHHKFAVIDHGTDNAAVLTGSYNWTSSAQFKNDENTIIIYDREIAELFYNQFYSCYHGAPPVDEDPVIEISINQMFLQDGNYMRVWTNIANPGPQRTLDEYIILDLGESFGDNRFYFWPSWSTTVGFQRMFMSEGSSSEQEILSLVLPTPLDPAGPFIIWAAFVDPATGQLACDYDFVQFSFY